MLPTSSYLAKKACFGAQVDVCATAHPPTPGCRPMAPGACGQETVFKGEINARRKSVRRQGQPDEGRHSARTIPTMALKINAPAAYIMPPACRFPRDEFRRFQVYPAGAGKFLAAQGWQLP